jgi:tetratricopeptide (TPR) repeat protein
MARQALHGSIKVRLGKAQNYSMLPHTHPSFHDILRRAQINYPQAERYYKKAAAIEDENPFYLNANATILWKMGRYDEAEPLCRHVLAIGEKTLGPRHPVIATYLNNLAVSLDS